MDILIKNLDMPLEDEQINLTILSDGTVIEHFRNEGGKWSSYRSGGVTAIELPPHGDLIERSKVHEAITQAYCLEDVPSIIDQLVSTVLEAST